MDEYKISIIQETYENLKTIQVGDVVDRYFALEKAMELKVTEITDNLIICGPWSFSRKTGLEIDEVLGWDQRLSGSYIKLSRR